MKKGIFIIFYFALININSFAQLTMTHGDVYNYDVGDVFLVCSYNVFVAGPSGPPDTTYQETTILNKYFSLTSDTVFYNCFVKTKHVHFQPWIPYFTFTYQTLTDTLFYTDLNSPIQNYPFMGSFPCYTDSIDTISVSFYPPYDCSRKIWNKAYLQGIACDDGVPLQNYYYVQGCGGPYYSYFDGGDDETLDYRYLYYYKKGTDSCGEQVSYTTGIAMLSDATNEITIYPNPTTASFTITTTASKIKEVKVFNVLGSLVISHLSSGNTNETIDMSGVSKGIYFVQIMDEKGNVVNKKVVVE